MSRRVLAGWLCLLVPCSGLGCESAQDDISFNYNVQNRGQRPVLEQVDLAGPSGAESLLNNLDERIENALY